MPRTHSLFGILLLLLSATACARAAENALPAGGVPLVPASLDALTVEGPNAADATVTRVAAPELKSGEAVRAETLRRPPFPWDLRLELVLDQPVSAGDTLWLGFTARRIASLQETGEALVEATVEGTSAPFRKVLERAVSVGPKWTDIRIPFAADVSAAAGGLKVTLRIGYKPQTIEIGDLRLLNFGAGVPVATLPKTDTSYEGRQPDHPWRKAAAERIERIRKADLEIRVVDARGAAVEGAQVEVRMRRHEFAFGTAIQSARIATGDSPDAVRYRETIERHFNKVVIENDIKWPAWINDGGGGGIPREQIFRALKWFREREIPVRGHVMVWPSWRYMPKFVRELQDDPQRARAAALWHIREQAALLGDLLTEWDVVNESYAHHDLLDLLGREVMIDWFKAAHEIAPQVAYFYNDYTMFSGEGPGSPSQHFHDTIRFLKEGGAPIGGIGEQGHFGGSPPSPLKVLQTFDRFAELGLPIQISEFDIDTADVELQVDYTRDFMIAAFSHPALTGIMCWGFWEGNHWKPRAAFWAKDWTLRPNGQVWVDLTTRQWWTNADTRTGSDGSARVRGFRGDYEVTVRVPGRDAVTRKVHLPADGARTVMIVDK